MTNKNYYMYTKQLSLADLYQHLQEYLSVEQQPFVNSKAYVALCDALWDYLQSDIDEKDERKQVLKHAKEVFEHYCSTETAPTLYTWSNELQRAIQ